MEINRLIQQIFYSIKEDEDKITNKVIGVIVSNQIKESFFLVTKEGDHIVARKSEMKKTDFEIIDVCLN